MQGVGLPKFYNLRMAHAAEHGHVKSPHIMNMGKPVAAIRAYFRWSGTPSAWTGRRRNIQGHASALKISHSLLGSIQKPISKDLCLSIHCRKVRLSILSL
jgi:hypothetical protein